jgi:NADPH:quinone reductase-like Zn-dependent oxidoreductase
MESVMRVWEIRDSYGLDHMHIAERPDPKAGPGQIVVAMKAASLNYRDLLTCIGMAGGFPLPLIPFSDGAGEVVEVGSGVTHVKKGDRVCPSFFPGWINGAVADYTRAAALGGTAQGVLQEKFLIDAEGVSKIPAHLSYEEAATLPCAGLTAWRAVAVEAPVGPGKTVLVQGTGGVSIFALQFAKEMGATVIATSSSDAKLARAKALGADHLINYGTTPDWGAKARELTGGHGVDVVVEVGGENTLGQSLNAARSGGRIVVIGVLGGFSTPFMIPLFFSKNLHMIGVTVGSREQFEHMAEAIDRWKLKPVVDKTFPFTKVPEALHLMQDKGHFGKIAITF